MSLAYKDGGVTTTSTLVIQYFVGEGHTDIANFI